jgi:hypothetical protein
MSHASITHGDGRPTRAAVAQMRREIEGELWEIEYRLQGKEQGVTMTPDQTRRLLRRRRELHQAFQTVREMS